MTIEEFILIKLKLIQKKHNFNPLVGIKQLNNNQDLIADFSIFAEYIRLIKKLKLNVEIPYKPFEIKSKVKVEENKIYVYFARLESNFSMWKIGHSKVPYKRGKALQTSNHESLNVIHVIPGSFELEQQILKYTIKYKTNGGSEWRSLDNEQVKLIVSTIRTSGPEFLSLSELSK